MGVRPPPLASPGATPLLPALRCCEAPLQRPPPALPRLPPSSRRPCRQSRPRADEVLRSNWLRVSQSPAPPWSRWLLCTVVQRWTLRGLPLSPARFHRQESGSAVKRPKWRSLAATQPSDASLCHHATTVLSHGAEAKFGDDSSQPLTPNLSGIGWERLSCPVPGVRLPSVASVRVSDSQRVSSSRLCGARHCPRLLSPHVEGKAGTRALEYHAIEVAVYTTLRATQRFHR